MIYTNKLIARGLALDVLRFLKDACERNSNGAYCLNFGKIIPLQKSPSAFLPVNSSLKETSVDIDAYLGGDINALRHLRNSVLDQTGVNIMDGGIPAGMRVRAIVAAHPNWVEAVNDRFNREQNRITLGHRSYDDYIASRWGGCIPVAASEDMPVMSTVRSNGRDGCGCLGVLFIFCYAGNPRNTDYGGNRQSISVGP
ncbi:hypothetical protein GGI1_22279 [Acidithiobacillus sp. GGI-221]|nr:hypothetical protein GGI1_22279 [Acidithiobacillus sp. GGI-221]